MVTDTNHSRARELAERLLHANSEGEVILALTEAGYWHAERDMTAQNERLFRLLANSTQVADRDLPQTGVPLDWERKLSSISVRREGYGTRASTVLRISNGRADVTELNHNEDATQGERNDFEFDFQ